MRKSISVNESRISKSCTLVEKLLKELNTMAGRKISLIKSDDEMGDVDKSKLAGLDDLAVTLDEAIKILSEI